MVEALFDIRLGDKYYLFVLQVVRIVVGVAVEGQALADFDDNVREGAHRVPVQCIVQLVHILVAKVNEKSVPRILYLRHVTIDCFGEQFALDRLELEELVSSVRAKLQIVRQVLLLYDIA